MPSASTVEHTYAFDSDAHPNVVFNMSLMFSVLTHPSARDE